MPGPKYTPEQKEMFFELIDRGGTVRAAAKAAGVHEDACLHMVAAGRSVDAAGDAAQVLREEKAEFFRRLALSPNVSAVARELGIHACHLLRLGLQGGHLAPARPAR